jgi:hypothetical protein
MPTTSPDNIWYPADTDSVSPLQLLFSNQATSVQNALTQVRIDATPAQYTDSSWTLAGLSANSPAFTGLSDSQGRTTGIKGGMRKWGPVVELRFRVTKGSGTITANDQGNLGDATVANIGNAQFRPAGTVYALFDYGPGLGSGAARIETGGGIVITDFYPKSKIEAGKQIQIDAMYFAG